MRLDSITRICDRLHALNEGSLHREGFCRACAEARVLLSLVAPQEMLAILEERGSLYKVSDCAFHGLASDCAADRWRCRPAVRYVSGLYDEVPS